jgi:hypothetical protein
MAVVLFVAYAAAFFGWFAALFTGRLPESLATFITRAVQYQTRVTGYMLLLTDKYPPFSLGASEYPISIDVTTTRLNRAAVFFRLILAIPAAIVSGVVLAGLEVAAVVIWLIVLISGRMPASLFEAEAAILRYQTRYYSYALLLTGEYAGGLFGDEPSSGDELAALPARPRITRLVLSQAGRRLVILFIVLGVVVGGGGSVASAINGGRAANTSSKLDDSHDALGREIQRFTTDAQRCAVSGGIDCIHAANLRLADAFHRFDARLESLSFPGNSSDEADTLAGDTRSIETSLRKLASISTVPEYQAAAREFQDLANRFDRDYQQLVDALVGF